jgi:hypothetical protein
MKNSIDKHFGFNDNQYNLIEYLIANQDKSALIDSMGCPTSKFNELLKYISYMSDFEKHCFLIYHVEKGQFIGKSFEEAIENILTLKLTEQQRDKIAIKRPEEFFPVEYDIYWFLKKYKNTFLPFGIHGLMLNDVYYFRRNEIHNPSIYNYFYHIIESAKTNISKDNVKTNLEKTIAYNNLNSIVDDFESKYNPMNVIRT